MLLKDLGMKRLTEKRRIRLGLYQCDSCSNTWETNQYDMNRKDVGAHLCVSCRSRKNGTKHGNSGTRLHGIWTNMKQRCTNTNTPDYVYYGGRGIAMCEDWFHNFESFFIWANENGYSDNLTIDRKNNNGNYEPKNCRWVDRFIQASNTRKSSRNTSGFVGVSYHKGSGQWVARKMRNGKNKYIGGFKTKGEAVEAMKSINS